MWWAALFACGVSVIAISANAILLSKIRFRTAPPAKQPIPDHVIKEPNEDDVDLPFQVANLTFTGISYSVRSSDGTETIELLKGVDGYFAAGTMTALMGSSGAGKTTLMDVLALRKAGGEIGGEVRLNGHLQEANSFRRCTGYVEQVREICSILCSLKNKCINFEFLEYCFLSSLICSLHSSP